MENQVEELKKINLLLSLGTASQETKLLVPPIPIEFIFGLEPQGLTFFECLLTGKAAGDDVVFSIEKNRLQGVFGNLWVDFSDVADYLPDSLSVKASILKIANASTREVIKSMARQTGCGGGDCGCGGH
jgi:hypothetical protein